jgi:hypothetical protein
MPLRRGYDDGSNDTSAETEGHGWKGPDDEIDDAEGHAIRSGRLDDGSNDDAEGHGFRGNLDEASTDDAEGHAIRSGRLDDGSDDDTEGHGLSASG